MKLIANAKINLTLDITGKRADGYHLLDSVFQSVSLCDRVDIEKAGDISVGFSDSSIPEKQSIAYKIAAAFFAYTGIKGGARVRIQNRIPTCSGMGGGSSDAAAVLTGLDRLYGTGLSLEEMTRIAAPIGADIPFCLVGGTARVTGIGEKVSPLEFAGEHPLLIVKSSEKPSTAQMYGLLDSYEYPPRKTELVAEALRSGDERLFLSGISNAFDRVIDTKAEADALTSAGAAATGLSGSGPSVFGIFENSDSRDAAFRLLSKRYNCYIADFASKGIIIE